MSGYAVPLSSSPRAPSTPGSGQLRAGGHIPSSALPSAPSTTPAGPPPSSAGSFTPADPPPSSVYAGSQLGPGKKLFKSKSNAGSIGSKKSHLASTPLSTSIDKRKLARYLNHSSRFDVSSSGVRGGQLFNLPSRSPSIADNSEQELDDDGYGESEEVSDDEGMEEEPALLPRRTMAVMDRPMLNVQANQGATVGPSQSAYMSGGLDSPKHSSDVQGTPRGVKRSLGGTSLPPDSPRSSKKPPRARKDSAMPGIAKTFAAQLGVAQLSEPDDLILRSEDIVGVLYAAEQEGSQAVRTVLPGVSEELCKLWNSCCDRDSAHIFQDGDIVIGIGPDQSAPSLHKAVFLGTLLLQLHHPPPAKGKQALAIGLLGQSTDSSRPYKSPGALVNPTALPKVLLDWLDRNHNPYSTTFTEVESTQPSPPAHYNFWDIIFVLLIRGKIRDVIRILRNSNFQHAGTAKSDGQGTAGYNTTQLKSIEGVINRAIQALEKCPALRNGDWHVTGSDWILFRKHIEQYMNDLSNFAEGHDREQGSAKSTFQASNLGLQSTASLSQSTRRAESRVPWTVYQNLKAMYGIVLGQATEIVASAQDWVEATIGLTVWWNGDDSVDVKAGSLALTRRSHRRSQSQSRFVDIDTTEAYLQRLAYSFDRATDDSDDELFLINSNSPVEVGLASVFEGDVEGVIGLLRGWSLPVASAVAEVATMGGWFGSSASSSVMRNFDESDLMVLSSFGQQEQPVRRDTIMIDYADALFEKDDLTSQQPQQKCEGWEISIALLARLGDDGVSKKRIRELLEKLPLHSDRRMDMILAICHNYGMDAEARSMTERYADSILENSERYGTALIYYARARSKRKVKDVLDLLISLSLVQSVAFPPLADLDHNLHALIFKSKISLEQIASMDQEAAAMLHLYLSGYATLRRFYDLRDEEVNLQEGQQPTMRPIARQTASATALLAVINSAADNIDGGLYDESRNAVVQVDGLLALLGEAMVFVNQTNFPLSMQQCIALLKAIEDLQTVTQRVYTQCEECFRSTLAAYHSAAAPASPRQLLKTMSSMTSASSFSLVGSSMLDSTTSNGTRSNGTGSSSALVKSSQEMKRGWDWRKGLDRDAKGGDALRILRLGLARGIARHWMEGA